MTDGACPTCTGPRLYNWVHRHAVTCPLLTAEDATQAAGHERLHMTYKQPYGRPATQAEVTLLTAAGTTIENADELTTVVSWQGYRHRVVGGPAGDQRDHATQQIVELSEGPA